MDDIAQQLQHRDTYRRHLNRLLTPRQRMEKMARMQEEAWAEMLRNPEGYRRFLRRNFKARAIDCRGQATPL